MQNGNATETPAALRRQGESLLLFFGRRVQSSSRQDVLDLGGAGLPSTGVRRLYMTLLRMLHSSSNRGNTCQHRPYDLCGHHGLAERRGHADHSDERRPMGILSILLLGGPGRLRRDADRRYRWRLRLPASSIIGTGTRTKNAVWRIPASPLDFYSSRPVLVAMVVRGSVGASAPGRPAQRPRLRSVPVALAAVTVFVAARAERGRQTLPPPQPRSRGAARRGSTPPGVATLVSRDSLLAGILCHGAFLRRLPSPRP